MRLSPLPAGIALTFLMSLVDLEIANAATVPSTCGRIADIPEPAITFPKPQSVRLRLAHDLMQSFSRGDGDLVRASDARRLNRAPRLQLDALPWNIDEGRRENALLVAWQDKSGSNDDNMRAIVLHPGESWCTPEYTLPPGARLRFEGLSIESAVASGLSVSLRRGEGVAELLQTTLPFAGRFTSSRQKDLALEPRPGRICFQTTRAAAAIGEARILVPEPAGSDPRPRWVVLTIQDGLRGDVLRQGVEERRRVVPTLSALALGGHNFARAIAPGCHTRASVWPVLMGRDLMRIDPLMRRQSLPNQAPLEDLYSRANLFISHLGEQAGYRSVFLGNNAYFRRIPGFGRLASFGTTDFGTLDTMRALPDLFARYGDERVLLVYYITAPHEHSQIPRRLFEAFDCGRQAGLDQCQCNYRARVRHADEALEQLQRGLEAAGLGKTTFQVVTADHGELFGDGMNLEGEIRTGREIANTGPYFESFNRSHGRTCLAQESDVPLVVHGGGGSSVTEEPVSGLDIFPTLLDVLGVRAPSRLDGVRLPISNGAPSGRRRFVSYGFCSDSVISGGEQLIWWLHGCEVRDPESKRPLAHRSELWSGHKRIATDTTEPTRLGRAMSEHEQWLKERLPDEAIVFALDHQGKKGDLTVEVQGGVITDFGPAGTVHGLDRISVADAGARRLTVTFDRYEGLYYVSTLPARTPVRFTLVVDGTPAKPMTFVGPMQIPLETAGRWIDPGGRPKFFVSNVPPGRRPADRPALRLWWQPAGVAGWTASVPALSEFDRVLREWGYIR